MLANEESLNWDIRHIRDRSIPIGRMGKLRKFRSPVLPRRLPVSEYEVYRSESYQGKSFQLIHAGSSYRKSNRPSSIRPLPRKGFDRSLTPKKPVRNGQFVWSMYKSLTLQIKFQCHNKCLKLEIIFIVLARLVLFCNCNIFIIFNYYISKYLKNNSLYLNTLKNILQKWLFQW